MYRSMCAPLVWGLVGCILVGVSGCAFGPKALRSHRPAYNQTIQQTEKEELLLNMVRARYSEPMKFLQLSSIVASVSAGSTLNANIEVPFDVPRASRGPVLANLGGGLTYTDSPTVTYVPLEGQQFVTQILRGASVDILLALLQSGFRMGPVMLLLTERLGPLANVPGAPTFSQFRQLLRLWHTMQQRGDVQFVMVPLVDDVMADQVPASALNMRAVNRPGLPLKYQRRDDGTFQLVQSGAPAVVIELHYATPAEAAEAARLLGREVPPAEALVERVALYNALEAPCRYNPLDAACRYIVPVTLLPVKLRSFADVLFYLAHGIAVPPEDAPVVFPTDATLPKLLQVRHSQSAPDAAFVAIPYRQHWFAIADTDIDSKENFALLLTILSLQTTSAGTAPSLTLPVGH